MGTSTAPGARLHVQTVGVSDHDQAAAYLRPAFVAADANAVAATLLNTQTSPDAEGRPQRLSTHDAAYAGILWGQGTLHPSWPGANP
jgi:hypothetical protein